MNELDNHAGDQQNPEVLKKQVESISRTASDTLEKQISLLGRVFPDAAERLRERQREAILEEHLEYNVKAVRMFKKKQMQALEVFLEENLNKVIFQESTETQVFGDNMTKIAYKSFLSTCREMRELVSEELESILSLKNEQDRNEAEETLRETLKDMLALNKERFTDYRNKITRTIKKES